MSARQVVLLTSSESLHPTQLLSRRHFIRVSPLAATLTNSSASVANKRLTARLSSLDATLTKKQGGWMVLWLTSFLLFQRSAVPTFQRAYSRPLFSIASALFHFPYPVTPLLATLTKTAGCIPTIPILELNPLRFTSTSASTFRRSDVRTFRRRAVPLSQTVHSSAPPLCI